jgi:hypothetical protein
MDTGRTYNTEITRGGKTDFPLSALFTFRLFVGDVPDLDEFVHSSSGDTASDMGVDVECGGGAVVC